MLKIGVIGQNYGNGHPISYSSIFNGYNDYYLRKYCKFNLIKKYLPKNHKNLKKNIIKGAKVTHIWTQNKTLSNNISKICNIPNICKSLEDMSTKVDAVILARDDYKNHLKMSQIFLNKSIPIFIDKLIVGNLVEWQKFKKISQNKLYMSCSSARYTRHINIFFKNRKILKKNTVFVTGSSRENWARYAHHLLEGLIKIYGNQIIKVRCLFSNSKKESYEIIYNNLNVYFLFHKNLSLPIELNCYNKNLKNKKIPYTDYFYSIKTMMKEFYKMIRSNKQIVSIRDMNFLTQVVLAGLESKRRGGIFISPYNLKKYE